ncbi:MAG: glycosyltransferase family 2 protein [Lachnospiraceae bacterium]|nr:glycosyltransferase family 2 protein [Lachnospiraceae bacterium]
MKNITAVILNYHAYWETEKCVASILDKHLNVSHIVIVDNASPNESYRILSKEYSGYGNIKVLRTHRNYGFAKGNNIGIRYARTVLGADYVLLLNSDIVITDEQFLNKLLKAEKRDTAVIGSRILLPDGTGKLLTNVAYSVRDILLTCVGFYVKNLMISKLLDRLKDGRKIKRVNGCSFLLTPAFFGKYDGLYPHTFLYCEEHIFTVMIDKAGLATGFADDACVFHNENQSAKILFDDYDGERMRQNRRSSWHWLFVRLLPYPVLRNMVCFKTERKGQHKEKYRSIYRPWLEKMQRGERITDFLAEKQYGNVAVYGLGRLGVIFINELKQGGIHIAYIIDQRADEIFYKDIAVYPFSDKLPKVDAVIITTVSDQQQLKEKVIRCMGCDTYTLEELILT